MSLLIVDNGPIRITQKTIFVSNANYKFLKDLCILFRTCYYLAAAYKYEQNPSLLSSIIPDRVHKVALLIDNRNLATKAFSYFAFIPTIHRVISKCSWIYGFYPGNVSRIAFILCLLFKKKYGIYLRGEISVNWFDKIFLSRASFVLSAGEGLCNIASRYCKNVTIVVPMINADFVPQAPIYTKRRSANAPWRLLYVGALTKQKGLHDLIEAMRILHAKQFDFELTLVGANQMALSFDRDDALRNRIHLAGSVNHRQELETYYISSDIFCFPSHSEGFPRVLYEAMRFQLPIITTFVGGISSVMQDKFNCFRINSRDSHNLANSILYAAENPHLLDHIRINAIKTFNDLCIQFENNSHASQLRDIIQSLDTIS